MREGQNPNDRVAKLWGETAAQRTTQPVQGWLDSALVLENYVQTKQTGSHNVNWLIGLAERLRLPRNGRWLSLGCGAAAQEIYASKLGLFQSMLAFDTSQTAIDLAAEAASRQGVRNIEFGLIDLNSLTLPEAQYDVVLMVMSLHHVRRIRRALSQVRRTLKSEGCFIINEYIGPRQFQFPDHQISIVNRILAALPPDLRMDCATGALKTEYKRMPLEFWADADPSEAICSDLIVREAERQFLVVERIDYGGTLLNLVLEHIVHNFDAQQERDVALIRLLGIFEDILIQKGVLQSDFTIMAMKSKPAGFYKRLGL